MSAPKLDIDALSTWRVGRKVGRTLYYNDELIGVLDRAEDAKAIVAMIAALRAAEARVEALESALIRCGDLAYDRDDEGLCNIVMAALASPGQGEETHE